MTVEDYANALRDHVGQPLGELTRRELNPSDYQAGRRVAVQLLDARFGHHDRASWITVPIDPARGAPREPTPVFSPLNFDRLRTTPFDQSSVARVLRVCLFVPVVKPDVAVPDEWWLAPPVLWRPSDEQWTQFSHDYEAMRSLARAGRGDELSSGVRGPGRLLMAKTNGTDREDTATYHDDAGVQREARKRGYYLRSEFIRGLLGAIPTDREAVAQQIGQVPAEVVAASEELAGLDRRVEALQRVEQGWLRRVLFGDDATAVCDLCSRTFPVGLLVAAHIKPRAQCSPDERLDAPAVVMSACRFGCDELYERGLLSVNGEGSVVAATGPFTPTVRRYLDGMSGRRVPDRVWSRSSEYFAWHRAHVFQE